MEITYSDTKDFSKLDIAGLFLSVQWDSGNYPDKLQTALQNSQKVYSAWEGDKLVGMMNALSDGSMTAYFPYLLVRPEYQGRGIGKRLVELMLDTYSDCARKTLIAYDTAIKFYESCGFEKGEGKSPMSVTELKT